MLPVVSLAVSVALAAGTGWPIEPSVYSARHSGRAAEVEILVGPGAPPPKPIFELVEGGPSRPLPSRHPPGSIVAEIHGCAPSSPTRVKRLYDRITLTCADMSSPGPWEVTLALAGQPESARRFQVHPETGISLQRHDPNDTCGVISDNHIEARWLGDGGNGQLAIWGAPELIPGVLEAGLDLVTKAGAEVPLDVVERGTDGRDPLVVLLAPRTSPGSDAPQSFGPRKSVHGLRSRVRLDRSPEPRLEGPLPPRWNGTITATAGPGAGTTLRLSPDPGPLARVTIGTAQTALVLLGYEGTMRLGCVGCRDGLDLPEDTEITVTVTAIDAWGREALPRTFQLHTPRARRTRRAHPGAELARRLHAPAAGVRGVEPGPAPRRVRRVAVRAGVRDGPRRARPQASRQARRQSWNVMRVHSGLR